MIILLLIIIACVLLFGKEETKNGISAIAATLGALLLIGFLFGSCS